MSNNNEINIKIKKKHLTLALIAIVATSLIIPFQIFAQNGSIPAAPSGAGDESLSANPTQAALTSVSALPSTDMVGEKAYYTIIFKTGTTAAIKKIMMTFLFGSDVSGAKLIYAKNIVPGSLSWFGSTVIYTISAASPASVPAGTKITIEIGGIVNPPFFVTGIISVKTLDSLNNVIDGPNNTPASVSALTGNDVSPTFMKRMHLDDDATGNAVGWNPNGVDKAFTVTDAAVTKNSAVLITLDAPVGANEVCSTFVIGGGSFSMSCTFSPPNAESLNYVIINP